MVVRRVYGANGGLEVFFLKKDELDLNRFFFNMPNWKIL